MLALLVLSLAPYTGAARAGSLPGASTFGLSVNGSPGTTVALHAAGVPKGYIASFCTNRVCAPFRVSLALPRSGRSEIEVQLIKNEPGAIKPNSVTVVAASGERTTIAFSRGTH